MNVNFVIGYVIATFVNNKASAFLTSPSKICVLSVFDLDSTIFERLYQKLL